MDSRMDEYLQHLTTENPNPNSANIDLCSTEEILRIINREDQQVPLAVERAIPEITVAVDEIVARLKKGGHLFYFGAGTSGRLGVLDASECPPTYGVNPELVQGYIAGGDSALRIPSEGCEDDEEQGRREADEHQIGAEDVVVGITASGRAPYVVGVADRAKELGAYTVGVVTNANSILSKHVDVCIAAQVGNEVVTGSTRMKSGTAQKLILNMLSTAAMIKLGKVYSNQMVDLRATNEKLRERAVRIFCTVTEADEETAHKYLDLSGKDTKLAILMYCTGLNKDEASALIEKNDGFLRGALEEGRKEK